jgi:hypothetical protein
VVKLSLASSYAAASLDKDLEKEGDSSAYRNEMGEDVLPCRIIKACFVEGASQTRGAVKAHEFKKYVRVVGHTAPIHFTSVDRCDVRTVKVGPWHDRCVDLRARTLYTDWYADVVLRFPHTVIGLDKVTAAIRAAGEAVGLCEMRIEKGFDLGGFAVEALPPTSVADIVQANGSPERVFEIPKALLRAASSKVEDLDKRNPKKKVVALANGVNGAVERHAADAEVPS